MFTRWNHFSLRRSNIVCILQTEGCRSLPVTDSWPSCWKKTLIFPVKTNTAIHGSHIYGVGLIRQSFLCQSAGQQICPALLVHRKQSVASSSTRQMRARWVCQATWFLPFDGFHAAEKDFFSQSERKKIHMRPNINTTLCQCLVMVG